MLLLEDQHPTAGLFFSKTISTVINEYFKALKVFQPLKLGRGEGQGLKKRVKGLLPLLRPQNLGRFAKHQGKPCPKQAREGAGLFMCRLRGCISDIWNLHCSQKFAQRSCGEICCLAAAVVRKAITQEKSPGAKHTQTQPPIELT